MVEQPLSDLERELLVLCSEAAYMGETTTELDERMLEETPGRAALETTLRGLVSRGLMSTSRSVFGGEGRVYEDDWWVVTNGGRAAIGKPPKEKREWGIWDPDDAL